jgi:tetratricopeptide (TPR) repeat protein
MKWPVSICRAFETLRALVTAAALCAGMAAAAEVQVEPQPVLVPQPATSAEAYVEFKRLYEVGDHAAAAVAGRKVVELTEQEESQGSETMQVALMNLGLVQHLSGDFVGAEASYLRVIALLEATGRPSSPRLARAQAGLAGAYYSARRYDLAAAALDRAVVLSRRTEGLFNEDQVPLLAKQADSLTQLGRLDEALQARRYAIRIVGRKYGERSVRYAQELEGLGRWYSVVGAYEGARAILMRALETVERIEGPASVNLVGPLTALAENAQRWSFDPKARTRPAGEEERRTMFHDSSATPALPGLSPSSIAAEGLRWLERAAKIANAAPEPSPQVVAAVRTQIGDWYQSRVDSDRALPQYLQAWQAATRADQGGRPLQEQLFGAPVLLQYPAIDGWDRYAQRPPDEVERRIVELELTVTAQGRVRDIKVIADAGEPRFATRTVQSIEGARYRPRFADGAPVDTAGVRFQQPVFVLRGEEKEEAVPAPVAPDAPAPAPEPAPEVTPPPSQGVG